MERSFTKEVELLKLGAGQTFHGEGILAVTKALLQSGISYVGGYQGAPVSHVMDVLHDARDIMDELGLHLETNACETKDNRAPRFSRRHTIEDPEFAFARISLPPATYAQEKHKVEVRWPAAVKFIRENRLNEVFDGPIAELGIICQGGMYNVAVRTLQQLGLADTFGVSKIPIYVLNVTYPLIPEEVSAFCSGKVAVLMVEEGQPAYLEDALHAALRRADLQTKVHGKDFLPMAGEYTGEVVLTGVAKWLATMAPRIEKAGIDSGGIQRVLDAISATKQRAAELLGGAVPARPPGFCIGCPERPVFSAMKLIERESGAFHISADIGCHTFSTLPPFNIGNTVLGYGLGLASNSGIAPMFGNRTVTVMNDGGFWHNGLTSGIANAEFNKSDGILVIMKNG